MSGDYPPLITAMLDPAWYPHPVDHCELIETHISWVILTGKFAYKLKKPLDLGFLDFSSLEKRRHCCHEELRLNGRLAPAIYLEVVAIGGTPQAPRYGVEPAIEYAVRMRQFDGDAQLDRLLARDALSVTMIDTIATQVAHFHASIADQRPPDDLGSAAEVWQPMEQNFSQIRLHQPGLADDPRLTALEQWSRQRHRQLGGLLAQRREDGFIRECHGDMHLGNMVWIDAGPLIFDGIEFNPALRWIDVISEIAFVVMDLHQHGRAELGWRFLNGWLEASGDYAGLALLSFYLVYRAMVRAKIAAIRLGQLPAGATERVSVQQQLDHYLALAQGFTDTPAPRLLISHGLSGSGKSYLGMQLLQRLGGIRLRSDVERKRLFGLASRQRGDATLYATPATEQTYQQLAKLAEEVLTAGYTVLVDATFLDAGQRQRFRALARQQRCPFHILAFQASEATLRRRLTQRDRDASDADNTVLSRQLAGYRPLAADEQAEVIPIDSEQADPLAEALAALSRG